MQVLSIVGRIASPSAEKHFMTKMGTSLYKVPHHAGGPEDILLSGSKSA